MAKLTKAQQAEKAEAIARLREWIKPGDTVYTILDHVSRSGMRRAIRVVVPYTREDGTIDHIHPNHAIGLALGLRPWTRNGRQQDGLIVDGCGMDMGFHLVYELSHTLYGAGYACLGQGKCPSNYHVNHRDRIRCEGVELGRDAAGDLQRRRCYRPDAYNRWEVPEDWPRSAPYDVGEGQTIRGHLLACLEGSGEDGKPYEVCPTCGGAGDVPNPDGPERFDLVHTDGYALRYRWL